MLVGVSMGLIGTDLLDIDYMTQDLFNLGTTCSSVYSFLLLWLSHFEGYVILPTVDKSYTYGISSPELVKPSTVLKNGVSFIR